MVINTVGPYWTWGRPLFGEFSANLLESSFISLAVRYRACVRHGVHYVDLTGEPPWVRDIIYEFDYAATRTGAIIVPSCGMDSIPSDYSIYLSYKHLGSFTDGRCCSQRRLPTSAVASRTLLPLSLLSPTPHQRRRRHPQTTAISRAGGN